MIRFNLALITCLAFLPGCSQNSATLTAEEANTKGLVGGEIALSPSFPGWSSTAMILKNEQPFCTGTLIAPRLILTAGHCMAKSVNTELEVVFPSALHERYFVIASSELLINIRNSLKLLINIRNSYPPLLSAGES